VSEVARTGFSIGETQRSQIRRCPMKVQRMLVGGLMIAAFVTCFALGTAHAQPGVFPNLGDWANTWLKVKLTRTVYHVSDIGVKLVPPELPEPMGTAYINITSWDGLNHVLTADIYARDFDTGQWVTTPFTTINIEYFAGSDLKFIGSAQLGPSDGITMGLIFVFTGKKYLTGPNAGKFILGGVTKLGTIGSSILEIDNAAPYTERWAGSATISGPMVPADSLPFIPAR
jgi:hypothetical protein